MVKPIYLVSGGKGGVGKSIVTMALVDYLQSCGDEVLLIETDTSTPDVGRTYQHSVETHLLELDETDGWLALLHFCADRPYSTVVINGAARYSQGDDTYVQRLNDSIPKLKRRLVTLWVINRQRDSLELLRRFMAVVPESALHVLRNGYFGEAYQFELYNNSNLRKRVETHGGKSVTFPDLANRVADAMYSTPMSIDTAMKELPIGNRAELERWRREVGAMWEEIIDE